MSEAEEPMPAPLTNQQFATTHWSVVLAGRDDKSTRAVEAIGELCCAYWFPLYAYVRRRGHSVEEAQDLTQEFFARLIEKHWLAEADRSKGRFRTFLLTALNHFLAKEWRRSHAAKRGGNQKKISLDDTAEAQYVRELATNATPEQLYERRWALSVMDRALQQLHKEYTAAGKTNLYDRLKIYLSTQPNSGDYDQLGKELEMSPGAVAAAVHRLRQHYRKLVKEEVAQTVDSPEELGEEMRWLREALS